MWHRRLVRWARLLVTVAVLVAMTVCANASTMVAFGGASVACCCPHPDDVASRRACPCCRHANDGDHCLPLGEMSCSQPPFVAPSVESASVSTSVRSGEVALADVLPLIDRLSIHRLERPPRLA